MIFTILGTKIKIIEVKLALSQKLKEKPSTYDVQETTSMHNFTMDLHNMIKLVYESFVVIITLVIINVIISSHHD